MKLLFSLSLAALSLPSCFKPIDPADSEFRPAMRQLVQDISSYAKAQQPNFIVIAEDATPQLLTDNAELSGLLQTNYLDAVDAFLLKETFFKVQRSPALNGNEDVISYTQSTNQNALNWASLAAQHRPVLNVDICGPTNINSNFETSYQLNTNATLIATQSTTEYHNSPPPYSTSYHSHNDSSITQISQIHNFLYIKDIQNYGSTQQAAVNALAQQTEDLLIIDAFWGEIPLTTAQVEQLKYKPNGARRLVVAYMSIGAAEGRRYYRQTDWDRKKYRPDWIGKKDEELFHNNYVVAFTRQEWQNTIFGAPDAYLDRILSANFDGVSLGYCNAYLWFENNKM